MPKQRFCSLSTLDELNSLPQLYAFFDATEEAAMNSAYSQCADVYELSSAEGIGLISLSSLCVNRNKIEHLRFLIRKNTYPLIGYQGSPSLLISALKSAIYNEKYELADELLRHPTVPAHLASYENGVLRAALVMRRFDLVRQLLENKKVKESILGNEPGTGFVLEEAIKSGNRDILDLLLTTFPVFRQPSRVPGGIDIFSSAFYAVGSSGHVGQLARLLELPDYLDYLTPRISSYGRGVDLLYRAATNGHTALVAYLLDNDVASIKYMVKQAHFHGILRSVMDNNHVETALVLIRYPEIRSQKIGPVDSRTRDSHISPVTYAIKCGLKTVTQALLTYPDVIQVIKENGFEFLSQLEETIWHSERGSVTQEKITDAVYVLTHPELFSSLSQQLLRLSLYDTEWSISGGRELKSSPFLKSVYDAMIAKLKQRYTEYLAAHSEGLFNISDDQAIGYVNYLELYPVREDLPFLLSIPAIRTKLRERLTSLPRSNHLSATVLPELERIENAERLVAAAEVLESTSHLVDGAAQDAETVRTVPLLAGEGGEGTAVPAHVEGAAVVHDGETATAAAFTMPQPTAASTPQGFFASAKDKAIGQLYEYRFKRNLEGQYTTWLGWMLSVFGTFSKQEKYEAALLCINVLQGTRTYQSLTARQQQALHQGRLGEITAGLGVEAVNTVMS
jgi:ankyrin repeat protein